MLSVQAKSCKARYIRIDGSTDSASRAEYVKRFQEDADIKVRTYGSMSLHLLITCHLMT